ncbi:MAG: putative transcriptional regulator YvhJ [Firmicutes bacterium ADurb.Bin193]|nr:MAG: putative transcriptional regulator YvhJ [Firmicutes bacterium ADurb.Bin193]
MNIKKYLMIICCVLGICLAVLSGIIAATKFLDTLPGIDTEGLVDLPKAPKNRANILVMGVDNAGIHTDTIMLISLDNVNKKVSILSIPRDTRIVHAGQYDKINHLYGYKGKEENTIEAVRKITGIPIHYYAVVDFKGFRNIIDVLGGVDFEVPNVNNSGGMFYTDPYQNLKISLKAGMQHLNGAEAEGLVRYRKGYQDADLGRIKIQQEFIKELLKQKLQLKYLSKALDIYREIVKNTRTNYSIADAASHLITAKSMNPDSIETFSLPGYGGEAYTRYGYVSCFIYNVSETEKIINEHFKSK